MNHFFDFFFIGAGARDGNVIWPSQLICTQQRYDSGCFVSYHDTTTGSDAENIHKTSHAACHPPSFVLLRRRRRSYRVHLSRKHRLVTSRSRLQIYNLSYNLTRTRPLPLPPPPPRCQIVKFLDEHRPEGGCSRFAMNGAAAGGHLEVVKVRFLFCFGTENVFFLLLSRKSRGPGLCCADSAAWLCCAFFGRVIYQYHAGQTAAVRSTCALSEQGGDVFFSVDIPISEERSGGPALTRKVP